MLNPNLFPSNGQVHIPVICKTKWDDPFIACVSFSYEQKAREKFLRVVVYDGSQELAINDPSSPSSSSSSNDQSTRWECVFSQSKDGKRLKKLFVYDNDYVVVKCGDFCFYQCPLGTKEKFDITIEEIHTNKWSVDIRSDYLRAIFKPLWE